MLLTAGFHIPSSPADIPFLLQHWNLVAISLYSPSGFEWMSLVTLTLSEDTGCPLYTLLETNH